MASSAEGFQDYLNNAAGVVSETAEGDTALGFGLRTAKGVGSRLWDVIRSPYDLASLAYGAGKAVATGDVSMPSVEQVASGAAAIPGLAAGLLVGPNVVKAVSERSWAPILEQPGETLFDLVASPLTTLGGIGLAAKAGTAARAGKMGQTVQKVAEPIGKAADVALAKVLPRYMHTPEFQAMDVGRQGEIFAGQIGQAGYQTSEIKKLNKAHASMVDPAAYPGGYSTWAADMQALAASNPEVYNTVRNARQNIDTLHTEMFNRGMIGPRSYVANTGVFMKGPRTTKDTPATMAGYTIDTMVRAIATDKALEKLPGMMAFDGKPLMVKATTPPVGYQALPKEIAGRKWKGYAIHDDVADSFTVFKGNELPTLFNRYLGLWKSAVVGWNVPTHINNVMGDIMYGTMAGNNPLNPANMRYYYEAAKEIGAFAVNPNNVSVRLLDAMKVGGPLPSFASAELGYTYAKIVPRSGKNAIEHLIDTLADSKANRFVLRAYDAEDQIFRYATYLKYLDKGMSPQQAAAELNKFFPNYHTTSPLGRWARGETGGSVGALVMSPFTSFQLEAMRIYRNAALEHPVRYLAATNMLMSNTILGAAAQGMSIEDFHQLQQEAPDYMKGRVLVPLPWKDGGFMDWTNFMPLAGWFTRDNEYMQGWPQGPMRDLFLSGPAGSMLELWSNKDALTGKQLYDPAKGMTIGDAVVGSFERLGPTPSSLKAFWKRGAAYDEEVPFRSVGETPETAPLGHALAPMLEGRPAEEIRAAGDREHRGRIMDAISGIKSTGRAVNVGEDEKRRRIERMQEYLQEKINQR